MQGWEVAVISGVVSVISSTVTAIITFKIKAKEEDKKLAKELKEGFAKLQAENRKMAQKLAAQYAIGFLLVEELDNPDQKEKYFIPSNCRMSIGRDEDNDVITRSDTASRQHAILIADEKSVFIEDLIPTNHTIVNNNQIEGEVRLNNGDEMMIGDTKITFSYLSRK